MWPHELLKAKDWGRQKIDVAQEKLDGYRLTVFRNLDGKFCAFGKRRDQHLEFLSRFNRLRKEPWFEQLKAKMPPGSSIDGELVVPKQRATVVPTALRDPKMKLNFIAFAVPYWNKKKRYTEPLSFAAEICLDVLHIPFASWTGIFDITRCIRFHAERMRHRLILEAKNRKIEGFVVKRCNYEGWYKVKVVKTADCVIMGTKPAEPGKFEGLIGSLVVGVFDGIKLKEVACISGMNDSERKWMTDHESQIIGRVVEVEYGQVEARGRLRQPQFVRFRDDKAAEECVVDQLM